MSEVMPNRLISHRSSDECGITLQSYVDLNAQCKPQIKKNDQPVKSVASFADALNTQLRPLIAIDSSNYCLSRRQSSASVAVPI